MIRIRINPKKMSDVTTMIAKGWRVSIYREPDPLNESVTVEKDAIKFMIKIIDCILEESATPVTAVEIRKYVHGYLSDTRTFYDTGSHINGMIGISEGRTVETTYAFFRSEELQDIVDEFGLKKVVFPKTAHDRKLDKVVLSPHYFPENKSGIPPFHTDGKYNKHSSDTDAVNWQIWDATYVYEYNTCTLSLPWKYDPENVREIMKSLTN